jgi:hypothetical protein
MQRKKIISLSPRDSTEDRFEQSLDVQPAILRATGWSFRCFNCRWGILLGRWQHFRSVIAKTTATSRWCIRLQDENSSIVSRMQPLRCPCRTWGLEDEWLWVNNEQIWMKGYWMRGKVSSTFGFFSEFWVAVCRFPQGDDHPDLIYLSVFIFISKCQYSKAFGSNRFIQALIHLNFDSRRRFDILSNGRLRSQSSAKPRFYRNYLYRRAVHTEFSRCHEWTQWLQRFSIC